MFKRQFFKHWKYLKNNIVDGHEIGLDNYLNKKKINPKRMISNVGNCIEC